MKKQQITKDAKPQLTDEIKNFFSPENKQRNPTLLLAGVKDDLVPISHSRNIQAAFKRESVTSKLIEFPDAGHGFGGEDAAKATEAMVAWFEKHLTEGSSEESQ